MGGGEETERGEPGVLPRTESEKQRRVEGREKQLKYARRLGEWGAECGGARQKEIPMGKNIFC